MSDRPDGISDVKIVFVNPPLNLEERYGKLSKSGSTAPPLGLCHLAAMCRAKGIKSAIIDANATGMGHERTVKEIMGHAPGILGITASTVSIVSAAKMAHLIKGLAPNIRVIIGGPHVTAVPEETMVRFTDFDVGVIGEGELTIIELMETLSAGEDLARVPGILFRQGDRVVKNPPRPFVKNLDTLPMPAWDLLPDLERFYKPVSLSYQQLPSTSLITSRGCSGRCTFCDRKVFGNYCRCFSTAYLFNMVKELYYRYGIRDILFDDDNFMLFKERLIAFCGRLSASELRLSWACNARVDLVDEDALRQMARAGCWQIAYGIECGNQGILDVLNKGIQLDQIRTALIKTKDAGIKTKGFFMVGCPLETRKTLRETMDFIMELPLDDFQVTFFTPLPGCDLYENISQYGRLEGDWSRMNMWNPVFTPHGLSGAELISFSKKAFFRFYARPSIIHNYLRMLSRSGSFGKLATGVYSMLRYQLLG